MSKVILASGLLALSLAVSAQAPVPPAPPRPPTPPSPPHAASDALMMASDHNSRSVFKGAPYAATAVSETRQVLIDGNRIERSSTIKLYRDSQGRTRQEQAGGVVFIDDVVAGKRYALNTERKRAREIKGMPGMQAPPVPPAPSVPSAGSGAPPPRSSQMSPEEARSWAEDMRRWARDFAERMRGEREADAEVAERIREHKVIVARNAIGEPHVVADHLEVIRMHEGGSPAMPPMAMMPPPGPGNTTKLATRDIEGVPAQGTKTTWTIAAGRIGNQLPIEIVSERWYSPELNVVVLSRHSDPRSGERIYRLEKIMREEPSAELFRVPADYEIRSMPPRIERK